ncbi:energy transducer TonB [Winogradskyella sp.]|uniref:energy transducer TonB n=1 Tax=Winogradskyella sp. TaxID=1883156 RepID=UPI001B2CE979|nr:energy transducer TonB [Winogradskyella sp.]MBO6879833.1 energy transducer TonB [Winogradskyella sp.]
MKNSKKTFNGVGQNTKEVKKSQKHDANLQKNSTLYFQIGLILCLLGTYSLFEMQFQEKKLVIENEKAETEPIVVDYVEPFIVEVIKPKDPEPLPSKDLKDVYTPVEDDTQLIETIVKTLEEPKVSDLPISKPEDIVVEKIDVPVDVPFARIEKVPVYPGCEKKKTNEDKRQCMSDKINKLVGKKFNTGIAEEYGITGFQRIHTQFTVDKNGHVTDVKIKGPHPELEKEAKRVIDKIPHMKPGYQRDQPVGVIYTLPIVFDIKN